MSIIFILLFLVLLIIGVPIWLAMGIPCLVVLIGDGIPLSLVIQRTIVGMDSFVMLAVPLFMLAGKLMNSGGITKRIISFCSSLVGHFTGGLAQVNIAASMLFAGISGSAVADASGLGTILIPSMVEKKYDADFSVAVTGASSMCGPIIPPSIPMVIAGSLGAVSVGKLFLGGLLPGILLGLTMMVVTYWISKKRNYEHEPKASFKVLSASFSNSILALLMPVIILVGILGGVVTATEAAGFAVIYALFVGIFVYRELTLKGLFDSIVEVSKEVTVTLFLIALASLYSYILTMLQIPQMLTASLTSISTNPMIIMLLVNFALLFLGCFISTTPALILVVPILMPIAHSLGIDSVQFLVVIVFNLCIAMLTPPVGTVLFITARIGNVSIAKSVKALLPYFAILISILLLLTLWPPLSTWLPNYFFK